MRAIRNMEKTEMKDSVGSDPTLCEDIHSARTLPGGGRHVIGTVRVHAGRWTPLEQSLIDRLHSRQASRREATRLFDCAMAGQADPAIDISLPSPGVRWPIVAR